jgi:hypothetical protein
MQPVCVTTYGWPATVSDPDRIAVGVFAGLLLATEKLTVPFPVPAAPAVILRKPALLDAVQEQPAAAVTLTLLVVPAGPVVSDVDDNEYEHSHPKSLKMARTTGPGS